MTRPTPTIRIVPPLVLILSSAVLLVLSFPNFNQPWCAWVALVPWLVSVRSLRPRQAFWWSYLAGLVFFLVSIWWLIHVTLLGWLALCAYLALFFGIFGLLTSRLITHHSSPITVPAAWVALEYLRSHLLSGFGWNLLGYSQAPVLSIIQAADLTGVWGVSFLIVMVNVALADYLDWRKIRTGVSAMICAALCVLAAWGYGRWRLHQPPLRGEPLRVAVVQGNIPQEQKWDEAYREAILERYERLTREAAAQHPDLIIWPEASVPGILGPDEAVTARIRRLAQAVPVPLLVGAPMAVPADRAWRPFDAPRRSPGLAQGRPERAKRVEGRLTNSAALLGRDGAVTARYDKLHLVPFGEFVPFESLVPWLRDVLPPIGDFVPGHDFTIFALPALAPNSSLITHHSSLQLSVLVCFEDVFPELARQFVRRGARWLVTVTNDAWFGKTAAPYQHAQASTFRAVELRVPMVRAANTGWSGCIDSRGRWLASVRDPRGEELFIEGVAVCEVTVGDTLTVYRRWGDWFAWLCMLGCLGGVIFAIMKR